MVRPPGGGGRKRVGFCLRAGDPAPAVLFSVTSSPTRTHWTQLAIIPPINHGPSFLSLPSRRPPSLSLAHTDGNPSPLLAPPPRVLEPPRGVLHAALDALRHRRPLPFSPSQLSQSCPTPIGRRRHGSSLVRWPLTQRNRGLLDRTSSAWQPRRRSSQWCRPRRTASRGRGAPPPPLSTAAAPDQQQIYNGHPYPIHLRWWPRCELAPCSCVCIPSQRRC